MLPRNHLDRIQVAFDDHRLVDNAGLLLPATLALHLGLSQLVQQRLDLGDAPRLTYPALGRRVGTGSDPGTRPELRLPTGCPTSWRDVLEGKGVRAAGRTLPLARTIKDGVPVVLRNV